jgi:hypothetical protein
MIGDLILSALFLVFLAFFLKSFERTITAPKIRAAGKERRRIVLPRTPGQAALISKFLGPLTDEEVLNATEAKYPFWAYMTASPYGSVLPIFAAVISGLVIGLSKAGNEGAASAVVGINNVLATFIIEAVWGLTLLGLTLHTLNWIRIQRRHAELSKSPSIALPVTPTKEVETKC